MLLETKNVKKIKVNDIILPNYCDYDAFINQLAIIHSKTLTSRAVFK